MPLKIARDKRRWIHLSYEELVTNPLQGFSFLCEQLEFDETARMLTRTQVPSRTTMSSTTKVRFPLGRG